MIKSDILPFVSVEEMQRNHKSFMGGYVQSRSNEPLKVAEGANEKEWNKGYQRGNLIKGEMR
jgi:hypothetical protein